MAEPYDAVVLAGGAARRLGGVDKAGLDVGGQTLLDRVLGAVRDAGRAIVVGPERPASGPVLWTCEDPPGGGPVAGLAAGLHLVQEPWVALLAVDLPFLVGADIDRLRAAAEGSDGALLVDSDGRDQLLVGVWRTGALRSALPAEPAGARLGAVLGRLSAVRVRPADVSDRPPPWLDCDTPDDLATARSSR